MEGFLFPVSKHKDIKSHPVCLSVCLCLSLAFILFVSFFKFLSLSLILHLFLPSALPHLHTYTLLFNVSPWVYTLLHALFPAICQENCCWTLETSQETNLSLGFVCLEIGQFKQKDKCKCQEICLQRWIHFEQVVSLKYHFSSVTYIRQCCKQSI